MLVLALTVGVVQLSATAEVFPPAAVTVGAVEASPITKVFDTVAEEKSVVCAAVAVTSQLPADV